MNELSKEYWSGVGKRLKKLVNTLLDTAIPAFVETGISRVCTIIESKLHQMYKNTIKNSLITLGMNLCGMVIVIWRPFGTVVSNFMAAGFFLASIIFLCFKLIKYGRNYGRTSIEVGKSIFAKKV